MVAQKLIRTKLHINVIEITFGLLSAMKLKGKFGDERSQKQDCHDDK